MCDIYKYTYIYIYNAVVVKQTSSRQFKPGQSSVSNNLITAGRSTTTRQLGSWEAVNHIFLKSPQVQGTTNVWMNVYPLEDANT